jgi:hypothetical protein
MESVLASLVKLDGPGTWFPYALVPRPLPDFIPGECAITGEIQVLLYVTDDAKIEAKYKYSAKEAGWKLKGGKNDAN